MISLSMIVKNEERLLGSCLEAISPYVNQIVIVDTGSTDNTITIAKAYTRDVFEYTWCDDFSAARNYSLSKAMYDWVLVLDADEIVLFLDLLVLKREISQNEDKVGKIKLINHFETEGLGQKNIAYVNRLFNRKYFVFKGTIHEQLVRKDGAHMITFDSRITADHLGYTQEIILSTQKHLRNIEMLKKALKNTPKDPYLLYQLGKSLYMGKSFLEASEFFYKALSLNPEEKLEYVKDLVESYGYALINTKQFEKALELESFYNRFGNSPEFNFLMGLVHMNNGFFKKALYSFERCLVDGVFSIEGINTFLPHHNIGVIYEVLGEVYQALKHYNMTDNYPPSKERVKAIISSLNERFDDEILTIKESMGKGHLEGLLNKIKVLKSIHETSDLLLLEGLIYLMNEKYEYGVSSLKAAHLKDPFNLDVVFNLTFAFVQMNNWDDAKKWAKIILEHSNDDGLKEETLSLINNV